MQLHAAQVRGATTCLFKRLESAADLDDACTLLSDALADAQQIGMGYDIATTTGGKSNPSALTVLTKHGNLFAARLVVIWKSADPEVSERHIDRIIDACSSARRRPKALSIDATNERYYAAALRKKLSAKLPVHLVVGSEGHDELGIEPMTMKQLTGSRCLASLEDNQLTLPPDPYIRIDWRLLRKERGSLVCTPDSQGRHADTFDATKLAMHSLYSAGGVDITAAGSGTVGRSYSPSWSNSGTMHA
jgi:hypothetical protein